MCKTLTPLGANNKTHRHFPLLKRWGRMHSSLKRGELFISSFPLQVLCKLYKSKLSLKHFLQGFMQTPKIRVRL